MAARKANEETTRARNHRITDPFNRDTDIVSPYMFIVNYLSSSRSKTIQKN